MKDLRALERAGSAPAVHDPAAGWVSYERLAELADEAVAALPPRTLFALEFDASVQCVAAYLGALRHGHVPLLVDTALAPELRQRLYAHFGVAQAFDGRAWRTKDVTPAEAPALHPQLGVLMSTSGSTGSPKLVRLSAANLQANAESIVSYMGLGADDRAISSLPLHYSYGLSVLNSHLVAGGSVVLGEHAVAQAAFWQQVREHGVTGLAGVPTTWRLLRRLRFERMSLPALRLMTQAGGRLDPEEVRWLAGVATSNGRRLFIMYGQTEATARIAYLPPDLARDKAGSIGQAIPGGTLGLLAADGTRIESSGVEGEIVYRGPNVMLGYAERAADLALGRMTDELRTGDLAYRDDDGHYWITGRLRRFIKLFGNRFGLDEVEQHVRSLGHEAAATGRDDCLMIGLVGDDAQAGALREALAATYRIHPSAIVVQPLPALPRNSAGKVQHAELMAQLDAAPTAAPA